MEAGTDSYLSIYVAGMVALFVWEQYLRVRKGRALSAHAEPPPELQEHVDAQTFSKTLRYNLAKNRFGYVSDSVSTLAGLATLLAAPRLWLAAAQLLPTLGIDATNQYAHAMAFVVLGAVVEYPVSLVLKVYSTFVIEEEFGFNKHTAASFAGDEAKSFCIMNLLISAIMYMPMIYLVDWAGPNAWYYLWAFLSAFVLVFNIAYPVVIAPLFNTFTPLEDEGSTPANPSAKPRKTVAGLREGIFALVGQTGLSCKNVFEVDGSKQSSHSNAYVAGICGQ